MNIVESMITYVENRDELVFLFDESIDKDLILSTCLRLLDWLKLYCTEDRLRVFTIEKIMGQYRVINMMIQFSDFLDLFEVEENSYELRVKIKSSLDRELRFKFINLVCARYGKTVFP